MKIARMLKLAAATMVAVVLLGCSAGARQAAVRGEQLQADVDRYMVGTKVQGERVPYYEEIDDFYISSTAIRSAQEAALPEVFSRHVVFSRKWPQTLTDIAEFVSTDYGVHEIGRAHV